MRPVTRSLRPCWTSLHAIPRGYRLHEINVVVPAQTPQEISAYYDADIPANAKLTREANVKLD